MSTSHDTRSFPLRAPLIAAIMIIAVYVAYVVIQYGRLNDRNERELASAAAELGRSIDNALLTATNFVSSANAKSPDSWCAFDRDQPYLKLNAKCSQLKPGETGDVHIGFSADKALAIDVVRGQGTLASFEYLPGELLKDLSFPESFQFIFVAGDDGSILYQDDPAQRHWRRWLRWGEREFRDSAADSPGNIRIENLKETLSGDKDAEWSRIRSLSGRIPLDLGAGYQAYLQPVPLSASLHKTLLLGGAVQTMDLVRQAMAIDSYFIALLTILLMVGLFGFPFIKLIALDRRERFSMTDVYLLYLSSGALLALLTFVVIGWDSYGYWSSIADSGLQALAKDLSGHFEKEVSDLRDQVVEYDEQIARTWPQKRCMSGAQVNWLRENNALIRPPQPSSPILIEQMAWISPEGDQNLKITADPVATLLKRDQIAARHYYRAVHDKSLFKLDDGKPDFFIAPDRSITDGKLKTFLSVPSRLDAGACGIQNVEGHYVVAAVVRLLSLDQTPLPAGYGFAVFNREGRVLYHSDTKLSLRENFFSQTSIGPTLKSLVFTTHSRNAGNGAAASEGYAPVTDDAPAPEPISGRYHERPHRFVMLPLGLQSDSPGVNVLYLAVFRDQSVERALVAHTFATSLSVTMLALLILLLAGALVTRADRERKLGAWLWPHGGLTRLHQLLGAAFLLALLAGMLLIHGTGESGLVLIIPIIAAAAGITICASRPWLKRPHAPLGRGHWQAAEVVLLALCVVIVPAATLFRLTLRYEFGKAVATERRWMAEQWADAKLAFAAERRAEGDLESVIDQRIRARNSYINICPTPYGPDTSPGACLEPAARQANRPLPGSFQLMGAHELLEYYLPIDNDALYRSHFEKPAYIENGTIGARGLLGITAIVLVLLWWIRWNTNGLFHAEFKTPETGPPQSADECERIWQNLLPEEKQLLAQVAQEHIANPRQKHMVADLFNRGLLQLAPDLQPGSKVFAAFLLARKATMKQQLQDSHKVSEWRSWRYIRLLLIVALAGLGLFLAATQPGWQSSLVAVATGVTGLLTAFLKLQDVILQWIKPGKS
ncbi:MAG TPA: cache domain-containing protein [Terriglobia bacterium]|nr:cache domain-containing protein [Terriglobia bacterium]